MGYDTELFLREKEALELIQGLAKFKKDISFATRKNLSSTTIKELAKINNIIASQSPANHLVALVSLVGFNSVTKLEPFAPPPERRILTIKQLHAADIPTFVYVKPLLPIVTNNELERIFTETEGHCNGYIFGYFITDDIQKAKRYGFDINKKKRKAMGWSLDERKWLYFIDPRIENLLSKPNTFFTSVEAINSLHN